MKTYHLEIFDSRNTSTTKFRDGLKDSRDIAKSHSIKSGFKVIVHDIMHKAFEVYENGQKTEWSLVKLS